MTAPMTKLSKAPEVTLTFLLRLNPGQLPAAREQKS